MKKDDYNKGSQEALFVERETVFDIPVHYTMRYSVDL